MTDEELEVICAGGAGGGGTDGAAGCDGSADAEGGAGVCRAICEGGSDGSDRSPVEGAELSIDDGADWGVGFVSAAIVICPAGGIGRFGQRTT